MNEHNKYSCHPSNNNEEHCTISDRKSTTKNCEWIMKNILRPYKISGKYVCDNTNNRRLK